MRVLLWYLLLGSSLETLFVAGLKNFRMDNNYNEIVRDVIKNWESPIVYLRGLGYLPNDYKDTSKIKPNLDALMSRIERDDQEALGLHASKAGKSQQHFCGTVDMKKKKREHILQLKKSLKQNIAKKERQQRKVDEGKNYPSFDQMMTMNLLSPFKLNKVKQLEPQQKLSEQQSNSELLLMGHLLAKQQQEEEVQQVPQSETKNKFDDFLERLVAKTSPHQQQQNDAAAGAQLQPVDAGRSQRQPVDAGRSQRQPVDAGRSQMQPVDAGRSQRQPVDAGRSQRQPVDAGRSQMQPVNAGRSQMQPVDAERSQMQPVDAERSQMQSVDAERSQMQPVDEGRSQMQPVDAERSQMQPVDAGCSQMQQYVEGSAQLQPVGAASSQLQPDVAEHFKMQPVDAESSQMQSVDAGSSQMQPDDAASSEQQSNDAVSYKQQSNDAASSHLQPVDAESSQMQPVDAESSQMQPVDAGNYRMQPICAASSEQQSNDAASSEQQSNDAASSEQQSNDAASSEQQSNAQSVVMPQASINPMEMQKDNSIKNMPAVIPSSTGAINGISGTGDPNSMSMYGTLPKPIANVAIQPFTFSRQDAAQSKINNNEEIEAPHYLNWDMNKKKLKEISPIERDAYVNKLVRIYVKKQGIQEATKRHKYVPTKP